MCDIESERERKRKKSERDRKRQREREGGRLEERESVRERVMGERERY